MTSMAPIMEARVIHFGENRGEPQAEGNGQQQDSELRRCSEEAFPDGCEIELLAHGWQEEAQGLHDQISPHMDRHPGKDDNPAVGGASARTVNLWDCLCHGAAILTPRGWEWGLRCSHSRKRNPGMLQAFPGLTLRVGEVGLAVVTRPLADHGGVGFLFEAATGAA